MCSELRRGDCDFFVFCRRRWEIDTVAQLKAAEECKKKKVSEREREKEGEIGEQKSFSLWRFDSPHLLQNISLSSIFSSPRVRGHTAETTGETNGQRWALNTEHLWHSLSGAGQWSPGSLPWLPDSRCRRVSIHGGYKCSCTTGMIWLLLLLSFLVGTHSVRSGRFSIIFFFLFGISFKLVTFLHPCLGNPFSWLSTQRGNK